MMCWRPCKEDGKGLSPLFLTFFSEGCVATVIDEAPWNREADLLVRDSVSWAPLVWSFLYPSIGRPRPFLPKPKT